MISIAGYLIDAAISEEHSFESEITSYPVERRPPGPTNGDVTDHVRNLRPTVTIEFVVSDTPIGEALTARAGAFALEEEGLVDAILPSDEARQFLEDLRAKGEPFTIETHLRPYDDMLIESMSFPLDADTGAALAGTVTFRQVEFVENRRTFVDVSVPRGAKKRNAGSKGARVVGKADRDPVTGREVILYVPGPGQEAQFWYAKDGVPDRPLSQEELDDMNRAFEREDAITYGPGMREPPRTGDGKNVTVTPGHYVQTDDRNYTPGADRPQFVWWQDWK